MYANNECEDARTRREGRDPFVEPTTTNAWLQQYPLTRYTTVFLNRTPGEPVDAKVKEFVRYSLRREGIQAVVSDVAYLPVNPGVAKERLQKLE
jgi:phosphate transport system substrate-binding protein